jgi:hypothetical protein
MTEHENGDPSIGSADGVIEEELTPLVAGQAEDESDAHEGAQPAEGFKASIAARDWTVETLVNQMRKGRIDLAPTFQRRNAWLGNRKSRLIESILIGYPIPQIVLAENKDRPGTYFVLDGKQRLLALRQFFVDSNDPRDEGFEPLRLEQLEVLSELNKSSISDLESDHLDLFATLENYTIRTVVLSQWNSERLLLSLFLRLNTGSLTLSPQELRQALIPGRFIQWLDATSGKLEPLLSLLGNRHPDRRMVDAELLLRFLAFSNSPLPYRGNLKQFLDDTCRQLNDTWATSEPLMLAASNELGRALDAAKAIFGENEGCRKWSGDHYERAVNRAVFDVQTYSLSIPAVREVALQDPARVEAAFQNLCDSSQPFIASITSTTKTPAAFRTRHRLWRDALSDAISVNFPLPSSLDEGR